MNFTQRLTLGVMATAGAALLYAEARALEDDRPGDTISEIIHDTALSQPIVMIAVGACAVHFAGGSPALQRAASRRPLLALGLGALVGAAWPLKGFVPS